VKRRGALAPARTDRDAAKAHREVLTMRRSLPPIAAHGDPVAAKTPGTHAASIATARAAKRTALCWWPSPRDIDMPMPTPTFADFEASARARGFDEVLERRWPAGATLDTHTHPFAVEAVEAVVIAGEMWLTVDEDTRHLRAGDRFELAREVAHAERYGDDGATYWVARRSG
jgi:hypothetical protein